MSRKARRPTGKAESVLSIDFGASSVKLCAGFVQGRTLQVERLTETPLPPDAIREGAILDPDTVFKALRATLASAGVKGKRVYLSVGGPQTTARPIRLPRMTPEVLQKSIQFEATRYLPSAAEEHLVGFQILSGGSNEQMEVLLVAAPRSTTDPLLELVEKAGLEPEILELQPFSALRTLQALHGETLPYAYALVDWGYEHTQITVARNATLVLTRFIPIASGTLSAALKGYFNYTEEEAEQIKRGLNLAELLQTGQPQENPPLRLIQPIVDELIREIRRSLNYYQSQYQASGAQGRIERLYLHGGGALMQGAAAYFEQKLGIPTEVLDPFAGDAIVAVGVHPEQLNSAARWAVALGAALAPLELAQPFAEPRAEAEPTLAEAAA
ncbi:MAG: type IV pilus assembly protein PilM [Fimbriimonadales bacterium]|nr:type IV pilus assembly protein PilM [Fimbriimonadales bacterium]